MSNEHYYQQALMCRERVMRRLAARKKTVRLVRRSSIVRKSLPQRPEPWVVDAQANSLGKPINEVVEFGRLCVDKNGDLVMKGTGKFSYAKILPPRSSDGATVIEYNDIN